MNHSRIEWTETTWNPVTGCTKISPGCARCYAATMAKRLEGRFGYPVGDPFRVTLHPDRLAQPLHWRRSRMVFVNSMSDLFHEQVPSEYIQQCFSVMTRAAWHTFQILTKRPERLASMSRSLRFPPNVWVGVSAESQAYTGRVSLLRSVPAHVRFISFEPLLGPVGKLDLSEIHWVIAGGESGHGARPMQLDWVREIRDQCVEAGIPFFLKQLGGYPNKNGGQLALLDGREWKEWPRVAVEVEHPGNGNAQHRSLSYGLEE